MIESSCFFFLEIFFSQATVICSFLSDDKHLTMKTISNSYKFLLLIMALVFSACSEDDSQIERPVNRLIANAGEDKTTLVNQMVSFDGSLSRDENEQPFTILWSIRTKPEGSTAVLQDIDKLIATFTPDVQGVYVLQIKLMQGSFTDTDEVVLFANAQQGPETILLTNNITTSTTLNDIFEDPGQPDYLVKRSIEVRAPLTLQPGVVIAFEEDKGLEIITGPFVAKGTEQKPIIFRGLDARPGYWKGILVVSNDIQNELLHAHVLHGGSSAWVATGAKANISIEGTDFSGGRIKISDATIGESGDFGLYAPAMAQLPVFSNSKLIKNTGAAAYISANQIHHISEVDFSTQNGYNGVETGGTLLHGQEVIWKKINGRGYRVVLGITIFGGVSIEPGSVFEFRPNTSVRVLANGYLSMVGTANERIHLKAYQAGTRWMGIFINTQSAQNVFEYAVISDGGSARIEDADAPANVSLGHGGSLVMENSILTNSPAYALVAKQTYQVNKNLVNVNRFEDIAKGPVLPKDLMYPDKPELVGSWVDKWSFDQGIETVATHYYDEGTGTWFGGAADPWAMNNGIGIRFYDDGAFMWSIAERGPVTGCPTYSAEFITGFVEQLTDKMAFNQTYWKSKFVNTCDPSWNFDGEIEPGEVILDYEITPGYDLITGERYWMLTFTNPDGSKFSLYRR